MSGVTYLRRWGLSINEGGRFFGMHMSWRRGLFFYVFVLGHRLGIATFRLTSGVGNRSILGGYGVLG